MRIAIVGAHRATKLLAPFADESWTIWSFSPLNENELPRCSAWFELHRRFVADVDADGKIYGDWLRQQRVLYLAGGSNQLPYAIPFPRARLVEEFGSYFFTSTPAWLLAKAITEEPDVIGLYGVHSETGTEYERQRPGLQHFIQIIKDRGIGLKLPPGCRVADQNQLYGFDDAA